MLRVGCASQIAVRAWASAACCVQGATGAAAAKCAGDAGPVQQVCRWFTHGNDTARASFGADCGPSSSSGMGLPSTGSSHAAHFSTTSTAAATAGASASPQTAKQGASRQQLQVATDIPVQSRAKLADELDPQAPGSPLARGRRDRRPQVSAASDGDDASALAADAGKSTVSELDEEEVRIVFNKLVGGLTKSGRKGTARRIVLDAMQIMRQQLRKGNLDEVK